MSSRLDGMEIGWLIMAVIVWFVFLGPGEGMFFGTFQSAAPEQSNPLVMSIDEVYCSTTNYFSNGTIINITTYSCNDIEELEPEPKEVGTPTINEDMGVFDMGGLLE